MPRVPSADFLKHRSGYELRVIGWLEERWPFVAEDRLAAAAHGLDVFKKNYPEDWDWCLEANAHPAATVDLIVHHIRKEFGLSKYATYDCRNGSASRQPRVITAYQHEWSDVTTHVTIKSEHFEFKGDQMAFEGLAEMRPMLDGTVEGRAPDVKFKATIDLKRRTVEVKRKKDLVTMLIQLAIWGTLNKYIEFAEYEREKTEKNGPQRGEL